MGQSDDGGKAQDGEVPCRKTILRRRTPSDFLGEEYSIGSQTSRELKGGARSNDRRDVRL